MKPSNLKHRSLFLPKLARTLLGFTLLCSSFLSPIFAQENKASSLDEALNLIEKFQSGDASGEVDLLVEKLRAEFGRLRIEVDHTLRELKNANKGSKEHQHLKTEHGQLAKKVHETQSLIEWLQELTRPPEADVLGLESGTEIPFKNIDQLARWVDQVFYRVWKAREISPADRIDDARYLRRVSIDIMGRVPSLKERDEYFALPAESRRQTWVDRIVATDEYGENFANYWNAYLLGRGYLPDDKHREPFIDWLRREFKKNLPHSEFVNQLIAVKTSNTKEVSPNAFLSARQGNRIANTNKISASFLGIDISCAQCHDDPYQRWTQNDYHAMVAFLARTREKGLSGNVYMHEDLSRGEASYQTPEGIRHTVGMRYLDGTTFSDYELDENKKPKVDAKGKKIKAKLTRREMLTQKMASDLQFAKAQVNRIWAILFNRGIVNPIENFTPDNRPSIPLVLDVLAKKFQESGFDNRWLLRVLTRTHAYTLDTKKSPKPLKGNTKESLVFKSFAQYQFKSLTGEQTFDSVVKATQFDKTLLQRLGDKQDTFRSFRVSKKVPKWKKYVLERREAFLRVYAWDPEKVINPDLGTIPQSLTLANGRLVAEAIKGDKGSLVASILDKEPQDQVKALVNATLVRDPNEKEKLKLTEYLNASDSKQNALEDILWSLLNTAEFRYSH